MRRPYVAPRPRGRREAAACGARARAAQLIPSQPRARTGRGQRASAPASTRRARQPARSSARARARGGDGAEAPTACGGVAARSRAVPPPLRARDCNMVLSAPGRARLYDKAEAAHELMARGRLSPTVVTFSTLSTARRRAPPRRRRRSLVRRAAQARNRAGRDHVQPLLTCTPAGSATTRSGSSSGWHVARHADGRDA